MIILLVLASAEAFFAAEYPRMMNCPSGSPQDRVTKVEFQDDDLVFDGTYFFQYDAWGRLIQINLASHIEGEPGPESLGDPQPNHSQHGGKLEVDEAIHGSVSQAWNQAQVLGLQQDD